MAGQLKVGEPTRAEYEAISKQYEAAGDIESANAAMAMAMEMPEEGAPGNGAPPPLLARPAEAPPMDTGEVPPEEALAQEPIEGTPEENNLAKHRQDEANAMPGWQQAAVGVGQTIDSKLRGAGQLYKYLRHGEDSPEYQEALAQENETRKLEEAALNTGWGKTGQIAGNLAESLIPGTVAVKGLAAGGKAFSLGKAILAQGGLGAASGATRPVVEGESRALNTAIEGGLGAAGAAPVQVAKAAALYATRGKGGAILRQLASKMSGGEAAKFDALQAVRDKVGPEIGALTKSHSYKAGTLGQHLKQGTDLPPSINARIKALTNARSRTPVAGKEVQDLREDMGAIERALQQRIRTGNATPDDALMVKAIERARRGLDDGVEANVGEAQSKALRALHNRYRTGAELPVMLTPRQKDLRAIGEAAIPASLITAKKYIQGDAPNEEY